MRIVTAYDTKSCPMNQVEGEVLQTAQRLEVKDLTTCGDEKKCQLKEYTPRSLDKWWRAAFKPSSIWHREPRKCVIGDVTAE
jgi:hypothetical protein